MDQIISQIKSGHIGVMPSDTLYGLMGSAMRPETVERIYNVRKRSPDKPMIVLISDISELNKFGIRLSTNDSRLTTKLWPGPYTIILPCANAKFEYLHRDTNSMAFRVPEPAWLRDLLRETGPLVAPTANREGDAPATTISEAKTYFGDSVDFYLDRGKLEGEPSTIIKIVR